jgi:hypothetical protein
VVFVFSVLNLAEPETNTRVLDKQRFDLTPYAMALTKAALRVWKAGFNTKNTKGHEGSRSFQPPGY